MTTPVQPDAAALGLSSGAISHPWRHRLIRILYLEDEDLPAELVQFILRREEPESFRIHRLTTVAEARTALARAGDFDVVLLDLNLLDSSGWHTFETIRTAAPDTAVVILTGDPDTAIAARAVREGAEDYLYKHELNVPGLLNRVLHYAVTRHRAKQDLRQANRELARRNQDLQRLMESLEKTRMALVESEKIKSLGQMAAGIAHEIKNPLAILRMGLDHIANAKPGGMDRAVGRVLPDLVSALERADTIVMEMLDYAAPRPLQVTSCSLNDLAREALQILHNTLAVQQVTVHTHLASDLPLLDLDRQKMTQVLINLIANALQAMKGPGVLHVTTARTSFPLESPEDTRDGLPDIAMIEIHDSGPGIAPEDEERIFDPFYTTKGDQGGTGLGLPVCKMILDLHGAHLSLKNHPDGGAAACISFIL